jgi:predicted nucleic acid-binding Zn ribbon protein
MMITVLSVRITMPRYDYICEVCYLVEEVTHSVAGAANPVLHCSKPMKKLIGSVPAIFKGNGWGKDK